MYCFAPNDTGLGEEHNLGFIKYASQQHGPSLFSLNYKGL